MIIGPSDWPSSGASCFEFRIGIEGDAAAAAARERGPYDLLRLAAAVERLEKVNPDHDIGLEADFAFHLAVAHASHNYYYVSVLLSLRETIFQGMLLARTTTGINLNHKLSAINEQHHVVYDAVLRRDEDAARNAMRLHLLRCKQSTSHWDSSETVSA